MAIKKKKLTSNEQKLIRRYLVWCYKTTKEELDKIDRYFTQLNVDDFVLAQLKRAKEYKSSDPYRNSVDQFKIYMDKKEENVLKKKFKTDRKSGLQPEYVYLSRRFHALEEAIKHFLGGKELEKITDFYEEEMTRRILEAREHT